MQSNSTYDFSVDRHKLCWDVLYSLYEEKASRLSSSWLTR